MPDIEKESFEVSAAHPGKVVVNGVDLENRTQLSQSQNKELQRFINNNAHKLGFYDRPHDEKSEKSGDQSHSFSLSLSGKPYNYEGFDHSKGTDYASGRGESPFSEYGTYGGKNRKGVSFADKLDSSRARSHSPNNNQSSRDPFGANQGRGGFGSGDGDGVGGRGRGYGQKKEPSVPAHPDNYNRYRTSQATVGNQGQGGAGGGNLRSRTQSPAAEQFKWKPYQSYEYDGKKNTVAPPIPEWLKDRGQTPAYTALDKHPDNYNKYETERHRILLSGQSQDRDEEIKFYGFGDRLGSGIELARKRWTGGETVTDPNFIYKSIKPRTMFYSPIGDGTVAADGIELRRGPTDLTPKKYVYHERVVEKGDPGQGGRRVYEERWDTGNRGPADDEGNRGRGWPNDGLGDGLGDGAKRPANDDDGRNRRAQPDLSDLGDPWPRDNLSRGTPLSAFDDGDRYPKSFSPLSIGTDGYPREGWTKTFITNPRELINQYGTETITNIFDLEDHTPKTVTTIKETISPVP